MKSKKKRSLTIHMSSRWYRAPEISLVECQYDQASDMWSLGCILYEIIDAFTGSKFKNYSKKNSHALFPGQYCFPLSPDPTNLEGKKLRESD